MYQDQISNWSKDISFPVTMQFEKLMVYHDLPHLAIAIQIVFDQRDLHLTPEFERVMDHRCQATVFKLETLHTITFI